MPSSSITPVEPFSMTTSETLASRRSRSRPSVVWAFTPRPRLDRLDERKDGPISMPVMTRMKS